VSKPGATPNPSESSKPMPEPDEWLLGELEAVAGAVEASGAKPASESSGTKASPSESSGSRKPVIGSEPGVMPAKPTRSATAALVGIGDDLIANASAEDKPLFTEIVAKAEAKSASSEPAVFDELGLAKTPAVITGNTQSDMATTEAAKKDDGKVVVAAPPPKKTDEGFPVPPPRPVAAKHTTPVTSATTPSTSTSGAAKPMSRWTPHLLLGTLGLASIVAIAFRCSGTSTNTAQADTGKNAPIAAKLDDDARRGDAASASGAANAGGGGNDAAEGGAGAREGEGEGEAGGGAGAEDDEDVRADDGAAAEGGGGEAKDEPASAGAAEGGDAAGEDAAGEAAPSEDAAKDDAQAADAPADQAAAAPTKSGTAKDTTPASTSSKSKSRTSATPIAPSTPSPESSMTAEELLALAKKAWAAGNARDTYKYANKSRYKKPSTEATELATLSACKLNLEKSAKSSFDDLSGEKRRKVRQKCRDWGVWVGL